jgi:hypothetical protein
MNRFEICALVAVAAVLFLCAGQIIGVTRLYIALGKMRGFGGVALVAGWGIFTFGPMLLAAAFHRLAKRVSKPWLLHLLLLPCIYGLGWLGSSTMLWATGEYDFDSTIGAPVMAGFFLMIIAVVGYMGSSLARVGAPVEAA